MLMMTTYRIKPFMTKDETKELMEAFAEFGATEGTISHYQFADGGGGVVIGDFESAAVGYRNILNYTQWVQYESVNVVEMDEALPLILDALS